MAESLSAWPVGASPTPISRWLSRPFGLRFSDGCWWPPTVTCHCERYVMLCGTTTLGGEDQSGMDSGWRNHMWWSSATTATPPGLWHWALCHHGRSWISWSVPTNRTDHDCIDSRRPVPGGSSPTCQFLFEALLDVGLSQIKHLVDAEGKLYGANFRVWRSLRLMTLSPSSWPPSTCLPARGNGFSSASLGLHEGQIWFALNRIMDYIQPLLLHPRDCQALLRGNWEAAPSLPDPSFVPGSPTHLLHLRKQQPQGSSLGRILSVWDHTVLDKQVSWRANSLPCFLSAKGKLRAFTSSLRMQHTPAGP